MTWDKIGCIERVYVEVVRKKAYRNMKYSKVIDIREYMNSREKDNEVYMRYISI